MLSKFKLRSKMLLSICSVVVAAFIITIILVSSKANSMAKKEAFEKTEHLAFRYSNVVTAKIEKALSAARVLAQNYEGISQSRLKPETKMFDLSLKNILEKHPDFSGIWVMIDQDTMFDTLYFPWFYRSKGEIISEPTTDLKKYQNAMSDVYYARAKNLKKEVLVDPYEDPDIHVLMTTATVPIISNSRCIGVVGVDIVLTDLTEMVKQIRPFDTGLATLISNSGKYVASPDPKRINEDIGSSQNLAAAKQAIKSGKTFTMSEYSELLKTDIYRVFVPVAMGDTDSSWSFSVEIPMKKVLEGSRKLTYECIIIGVVSVLMAGFAIFFISGSIVRPIKTAVAGLKDIAQGEGDLTMRLEVNTKDEIGELSTWFNTFIEKLQGIIRQIDDNAKAVHESSTGLSLIATQMSSGAEDTAGRANAVATATEEMTANLTNVAAAMEESSTNTNVVAAAAEEMTSTINEIAKNAGDAKTISDEAVQKAENASTRMSELGRATQVIGKVTEAINDISEQTNLLALNATIEAARAGEAGKGFAVVAGEIKELARQTAKATLDIKTQIEGVQETTATTVTDIDEITIVINGVNEIVTNIAAAVEEQSAATNEIAGNINQVSQGISEVNENINQCSAVAEEISRDITQVNSEAKEISKGSGQVGSSAGSMNEMASQLKVITGKFKV